MSILDFCLIDSVPEDLEYGADDLKREYAHDMDEIGAKIVYEAQGERIEAPVGAVIQVIVERLAELDPERFDLREVISDAAKRLPPTTH